MRKDVTLERKSRGENVQHEIAGSFNMGGQYHYTLETQACHCEPVDGGLRLRSATQWPDLVQVAVAQMLRLREADVLVESRHVGGAYGGKATRSALTACACALVASRLCRPARVQLPIRENMRAVGKRGEFEADYRLGVDADGLLQYLDVTYYCDCGCSFNDSNAEAVKVVVTGLYASDRFRLEGYNVRTDKASNTWCRAPGNVAFWNTPRQFLNRSHRKSNRGPR